MEMIERRSHSNLVGSQGRLMVRSAQYFENTLFSDTGEIQLLLQPVITFTAERKLTEGLNGRSTAACRLYGVPQVKGDRRKVLELSQISEYGENISKRIFQSVDS